MLSTYSRIICQRATINGRATAFKALTARSVNFSSTKYNKVSPRIQ